MKVTIERQPAFTLPPILFVHLTLTPSEWNALKACAGFLMQGLKVTPGGVMREVLEVIDNAS